MPKQPAGRLVIDFYVVTENDLKGVSVHFSKVLLTVVFETV